MMDTHLSSAQETNINLKKKTQPEKVEPASQCLSCQQNVLLKTTFSQRKWVTDGFTQGRVQETPVRAPILKKMIEEKTPVELCIKLSSLSLPTDVFACLLLSALAAQSLFMLSGFWNKMCAFASIPLGTLALQTVISLTDGEKTLLFFQLHQVQRLSAVLDSTSHADPWYCNCEARLLWYAFCRTIP